MPAAFDYIQAHPWFAAVAALLVLFLALTVVKKLVGWALVLVLALIGYGYFLQLRGEKERIPSVRDVLDKAQEAAKDALEKK
jgi:hypothetical protein